MKFAKRTLSVLLAVLMLMGLLPLSAMAEEKILIHAVEATCDLVLPTYGQDFEKPRSFTMTVVGDLPIEFNSSSSDWYMWDGTDWQTKQGGAFTDGTYCYDVHVRVTDDNYALAGDCTITVNGVLWPNPLETGYNQSAPFTIDYVAGLPLVFDKVSNYTIGANYVGEAISSYSVASTVIGGTKPYTFAKTSGPDWITVSADGTVSGTPTAIGDNEDLVITVTDAVGEQANITVPVSGTYIDPEDRQVISRVVADVTYPVLKCGDDRTREISATVVTEGAPAYFHTSNSDWYHVDGEGNIGEGYYQPTMVAGTYVMDIDLRVDGEAGYTHMLDRENLEVIINGAPAILKSAPFVGDIYSNVWVYSVPIVIEHTYDNDTDSTCNGCGVTARPGCDHQYAAACDDVCSVCGVTRVVADNLHTYDNAFDTACNGCGDPRAINYIAVGDTKTVALTASGEYLDFVFAPTVSGKYVFYSTSEGSLDTYGLLYDADENLLKNDDQSGGQGHFKITFDATAGTSYILRAKMYGSLTPTVPFEVKLVCAEHVYTHGCDPTCDICGETRTEFVHTYDNGLDTTCNECGAVRAINYIAIGDTKTAEIAVAGQKAEFVFIPTATAKYIFTSLATEGDPYGEIFLTDGTKIAENDDSAGNRNFKIEKELEAGTTYILCARYYSASVTGSYEVKLECGHGYDNACDAICNACGATREVGEHQYSAACDADCNECGAIREAGEHTYTDCTDTSCNACGTTRTAPGHVYDGCEDTECNVCGKTRSAQEHQYYDCYDITCEKCDYTRSDVPAHDYEYPCTPYCRDCGAPNPSAPVHTYDGDCDDECNVCDWGRIPPHTYGDDDTCDACGKGCLIVLDRIDLTIADDSWMPKIGDTLDSGTHLPTATVEGGIPFEAGNGDDGWKVYDETTGRWNWMDKGDVFEDGKSYQYWWLFIGCAEDKATTLYRLSEDVKVYVNGVLWSIMEMDEDFNCGTEESFAWCYVTAPAITLCNHTYSNACDKTCDKCGETREVAGHDYKKVITKATLTKDGKSENVCTICGYTASKVTTIYKASKISLSKTSYTYNGKVQKPSVIVKDSKGNTISSSNYTVTYASGLKNAGTYKVTVTMKGNYTGTKTLSYTIKGIDVSKCSITLSKTSYTYNGKVQKPSVTVKNASGTKLSTSSYTVTYPSGMKNAGTYKVTVKMKGNYTGTVTKSYKIKAIDVSKCKISLSKTSYTYTGKVQKPSVTVKNASGTKLSTASYTVTYASGLKNVGTYKVTIKMKGNYTGTKTLTFKINPPKTTLSSLTAGTKKLTVKWAKKTTQVTGYEIQYSTSKSFSSVKTKTITKNSTVSTTLSSLKAKTTYYVRIRTYKVVDGKKYYSGWSAVKYLKTK